MDGLWESIDQYCERTGPELWSEPLNVITNLAFIIAGIWGIREVRKRNAGLWAETLGWLVVLVGIGSGLFHTVANRLTMWGDVIPIAVFTLVYTLFNLRRYMRFGWPASIAVFVAYYVFAVGLTIAVPEWLKTATNGTTGYIAPFMGLFVFGLLALRYGSPAGWYNLAAVAIFVVSVAFRVMDPMVCDALPIGTHFLWHTLNGLMLGVLLAAAARYGHPMPGRR